jgi:hypothetical protein
MVVGGVGARPMAAPEPRKRRFRSSKEKKGKKRSCTSLDKTCTKGLINVILYGDCRKDLLQKRENTRFYAGSRGAHKPARART